MDKFVILPTCSDLNRGDQALVWQTMDMAKKEELEAMGALKALMSGSGPAVIGIFESFQAAQRARQAMKQNYSESYLVSSYGGGDYANGI
jgi:4-diphosphocytidyl-2C-methyl-D-erythritol kinase